MAIKTNVGYLGIAIIDGVTVRCTDFSVNVKQDVLFYDHVLGLRDSLPSAEGVKGDVGKLNVQKHTWRPGVKAVSGGLTFPATTDALNRVFDLVKTGDDFTLFFNYSCQGEVRRVYTFCKVNSMAFSVTAGDVLVVTLDIIGRGATEDEGGNPTFRDAQKLITWDAVKISSISTDAVASFDFSVNNNCTPIYTAGSNSDDLFPHKIRVGMQEMTGVIGYYKKGIALKGLGELTGINTISIDIGSKCDSDFNEKLCVIYKPIERQGSVGVLVHALPFVGVGNALGKA